MNHSPSGLRGRAGGARERPPWRTVVTSDRTVTSGFLAPRPGTREITPLDSELVEVSLLLPRWQAEALEAAAHDRGLTAGQMLRKLIAVCLKKPVPARA